MADLVPWRKFGMLAIQVPQVSVCTWLVLGLITLKIPTGPFDIKPNTNKPTPLAQLSTQPTPLIIWTGVKQSNPSKIPLPLFTSLSHTTESPNQVVSPPPQWYSTPTWLLSTSATSQNPLIVRKILTSNLKPPQRLLAPKCHLMARMCFSDPMVKNCDGIY